ncbi:MAG: radical SAM protein [Lachnospiraceae bacterium]|nr:radical SAM protein [Lachnospiraceae bacterium]
MQAESNLDAYQSCSLCPRACGIDRSAGKRGFCGTDAQLRVVRAALHYWEEPCISETEGSGAVFFSGCNLGCVFCQNYEISHLTKEMTGIDVSPQRLAEIFFSLQEQQANNINLVTADVHIPAVAEALRIARTQGLSIPVIFNSSSYVNVGSLHMLEGLVDVYLPDFKFYSSSKAAKYLRAADYPQTARRAIEEMVRQTGNCSFDENGRIQKGVIVRHLLMPHGLLEAKMIVKELYHSYGDAVYLSLMNQYTPIMEHLKRYPELQKGPSEAEYTDLIEYALALGVKNAYMQEGGTVSESFIPAFDGTGVESGEGTQV